MKEVNLLMVDDDEVFTYLTQRVFESTGMVKEITLAENGRAAIDFIADNCNNAEKLPDLILLDLNMPELDGWGFIEEFRPLKKKLSKKIDLYIMSSSISPHEIERAKGIPEVLDYIVKPVTKIKFETLAKRAGGKV